MDKTSDLVDFDTFKSIMQDRIPPQMVKTLFNVFDANEDGMIDSREFLVGFSTACRGSGKDQLLCKISVWKYMNKKIEFAFVVLIMTKTGS